MLRHKLSVGWREWAVVAPCQNARSGPKKQVFPASARFQGDHGNQGQALLRLSGWRWKAPACAGIRKMYDRGLDQLIVLHSSLCLTSLDVYLFSRPRVLSSTFNDFVVCSFSLVFLANLNSLAILNSFTPELISMVCQNKIWPQNLVQRIILLHVRLLRFYLIFLGIDSGA